jgi:hypothetical protein
MPGVPASNPSTRVLLPEAAFPFLPPLIFTVVFGPWDAVVFGIPLALVLFVLGRLPWRIEVGGGAVRLDFLPFGWMRRTYAARSVSGELGWKQIVLDLPEPGVFRRESVSVYRPGDERLVKALRAEGVVLDPPT